MVFWLIKFAMCAFMPRTKTLEGIADTDLDGFLHKMKVEADSRFWLGLVMGAVVFQITPLVTVGLPLLACMLPRELLEQHAERILSTPFYLLRQGVFLVRLSAGMCWGMDPKVRAHFALPAYGPDPGTFRQS